MFPNMLCGACKSHNRRNLKMNMKSLEPMSHVRFKDSTSFNLDPDNIFIGDIPLKPNKTFNRNKGGIRKMTNKVPNFSDLIHRVTASCMLHPLGSSGCRTTRETEMMTLISEVFETVSSMKKAYVSLQQAHCPWDVEKIRLSDAAVVAEMRRLAVLRERFRRIFSGGSEDAGRNRTVSAAMLREVVAPYEAALEKMNTEIINKQAEVDDLRQKLKGNAREYQTTCGRKSSHQSRRRVSCSSQFQRPSISLESTAIPELFEACMSSIKECSRTFSLLLLSLMKAAHWDIKATVKSIITTSSTTNVAITDSVIGPNHAKYSIESFVNRKFFQGFDHETFYIDGSLSTILNPNQFRMECFTQYSDMKSMDPMELLGMMPTSQFGKFCSNKYLSIVHPKMEESLFGDLEQRRRQVLAGNHPRSRFYGEFLAVAKAVWLLHLFAFSLDPLPSHFEGSRGAEFHPEYMESVVRHPGGRVRVVGFPVSPGFKLGDGYVVKARVYLVPKSEP
ncbi:putative protein gravitropic in the light 1 [Helianthus debilis subsp. tardiflorus]